MNYKKTSGVIDFYKDDVFEYSAKYSSILQRKKLIDEFFSKVKNIINRCTFFYIIRPDEKFVSIKTRDLLDYPDLPTESPKRVKSEYSNKRLYEELI